jgi:F0F1-type ATP synthase delta subunit
MKKSTAIHRAAKKIICQLLQCEDMSGTFAVVRRLLTSFPPEKRLFLLQCFLRELNHRLPYRVGSMETPEGVSDEVLEKVSGNFSSLLGRKVFFQSVQNERLLGGVRITIGDERWGRSIAKCLEIFVAR